MNKRRRYLAKRHRRLHRLLQLEDSLLGGPEGGGLAAWRRVRAQLDALATVMCDIRFRRG